MKKLLVLNCLLCMIVAQLVFAVQAKIKVVAVSTDAPDKIGFRGAGGQWYYAYSKKWRADLLDKLHALAQTSMCLQNSTDTVVVDYSTNSMSELEVTKVTLKTNASGTTGCGTYSTYVRSITLNCADTSKGRGYYTFTTNCPRVSSPYTFIVHQDTIGSTNYNRIFSEHLLAISNMRCVQTVYNSSKYIKQFGIIIP